MKRLNRRQRVLLGLGVSVVFLILICVAGILSGEAARVTDFSRKIWRPAENIFLEQTGWGVICWREP